MAESDKELADSYVAWCRYTYDESGGIQTIVTCDSDAKDAFKVYRAPNQSEIERVTQERDELSEEMTNCHHMLDLELDEYEEGMVSLETLETRLRGYFHGLKPVITDDTVNGDD